jgi:Flp pilus assembly protein TadG
MVEFAIILPFLLALIIAIMEFGRIVFIYAAVTNSSREAARFGSAIGFQEVSSGNYYLKYQYCAGIRKAAKRTSFLVQLTDSNIAIGYDQGPGTTLITTKCPAGTVNDPTVVVKMGQDRIKVTVTATYAPLTKLLPISQQTITSSSARTILGNTKVGP